MARRHLLLLEWSAAALLAVLIITPAACSHQPAGRLADAGSPSLTAGAGADSDHAGHRQAWRRTAAIG